MRNIRNWLVVATAIVLTGAVMLVTGLVSFGQDARFEEDHPFTSIPEFPSANESDAATLREAAATFLESTGWSEADSPGTWRLADVAALTRRGVRIGVYADVEFGAPAVLAGPRDFIRCGQVETWEAQDGKVPIGGLRIWLLDGGSNLYNVLPMNEYGDLPRLQEVQSFVAAPVACATG